MKRPTKIVNYPIGDTGINELLNQLKADIISTKDEVRLDYQLVRIYIEGHLGYLYSNGVADAFGAKIPIHTSYSRLKERWDTAATTLSQQTASRFRLSLLPDGLESMRAVVDGINNSVINDFFTEILRKAWPKDALTQINLAVSDYLNYGTAIMSSKGRHIDINTTSF